MKHETPIDLWLYEKEAFADGFQLVCGVDEAGRGPLAGPVCAAAVILPPELVIPGLNDSKKLTDKKRRELCSVITAEAVSYGIAFASEQEIDEINILQATFLAMERAMAQLAPPPEFAAQRFTTSPTAFPLSALDASSCPSPVMTRSVSPSNASKPTALSTAAAP